MTLESALVAGRFVHFASAMPAFGAALFPLYTGVEARFPMRLVATAALLSGMAWFACTLVNVAGDPATGFSTDEILLVLFKTGFGQAWLVHLALGAVLLATTLTRWRMATILAATLNLLSLAGIGHAAMGGRFGLAHLVGHMAHLCAGGVWLGALIPLLRALGRSDGV